MPKISTKQLVLIGVVVAVVVGFAVLIFAVSGGKKEKPVALAVWGTESKETMEAAIGAYTAFHPTATITYKEVAPDVYDATLLNALAAGTGPDIFMIPNRALFRQIDKLAPASAKQMSVTRLQQLFPTVVEEDFTYQNAVFALPLSIDTLGMFYGRDAFDRAGVAKPPATWDEFVANVEKLRALDSSGNIVRAAAPLGASDKNFPAAVDLLNLLLLQNGAPMVAGDLNSATFASQGGGVGVEAFKFYLQFSDPTSPNFTWNDSQPKALDALVAGRLALFFDYHSALTAIRKKSPYFKLGTVPVPQVDVANPVNYARYSGLAVSRQSKAVSAAWDFIVTLTTTPGMVQVYLDKAGAPPALRSMLAGVQDDAELGPFVGQVLTARSWPMPDDVKTNAIFSNAIRSVLRSEATPKSALKQAEAEVTQLLKSVQ